MDNKKDENKQSVPEVSAKITWVNPDSNANKRASANITIGKCFTVHGLSVMKSDKGLFVSMPTKVKTDQSGENKYYDVAHPVTAEMRQQISDKVLEAYQKMTMAETHAQSKEQVSEVEVKSEELPSEITDESEGNPFDENPEDEDESEGEVEDEDEVPIMGQTM